MSFNWKSNTQADKQLKELANNGYTQEEIAQILSNNFKTSISRNSVKNRLKRAVASPEEQTGKQDTLIKRVRSLEGRLSSHRTTLELTCDFLTQSLATFKVEPIKMAKPHVNTPNKLTMDIMWSDWHMYSIVDEERTQGVANYNISIFEKRLNNLITKIIKFKEEDQQIHSLDKLTIFAIGDFVEGEEIFPTQSHFISASGADQVIGASKYFVSTLTTLAEYFNEIEVFAVKGNHGRPGGKKSKFHPDTNFDYLAWYIAKTLLEKNKGIKIHMTKSPLMLVKRGNFIFGLEHGDTCQRYNDVPYYSVKRRKWKLADMHRMTIDYLLMGHFHDPSSLSSSSIQLNGSMVGGSDLSVNQMAESGLPSQKMWYFSEKHGINRQSNLILDSRPILKPNTDGILTPSF